jgi:hypothetical protein
MNQKGNKMNFWQWLLGYFILEYIEEETETEYDE